MSNKSLKINSFKFLLNSNQYQNESEVLFGQLVLTCFDIFGDLIVFGSNHGLIYGYKRNIQSTFELMFTKYFKINFISKLVFIDRQSLVVMTKESLCVVNLISDALTYQWKSSNFGVKLTCIKWVIEGANNNVLILSGDSSGTLRKHDLINFKDEIIFEENQNLTAHQHEIIQIDGSNLEFILISTCYRSLILKKNNQIVQIGKNVRKVCGQYGAVFNDNNQLVFASRPSLHLIKANSNDGNVIETFKIKKAIPNYKLESQKCKFESNFLNHLGYLIYVKNNVNEWIVSWNNESLVIVQPKGSILVKETFFKKIINCQIFANELFLLLENEIFLWFNFNIVKQEYDFKKIRINFSKITNELIKETEFVLNREMFYPLAVKAVSRVEEEFKKIHSIVQSKLIKENDQEKIWKHFDSTQKQVYTNNLNEKSNCDLEDLEDDNIEMPLVIHKKIKKKIKNFKSNCKFDSDFEAKSDFDFFSSCSLSIEEPQLESDYYLDLNEEMNKSESFFSKIISYTNAPSIENVVNWPKVSKLIEKTEQNHDYSSLNEFESSGINSFTSDENDCENKDGYDSDNDSIDVKILKDDNKNENNNKWNDNSLYELNNFKNWKVVFRGTQVHNKLQLVSICASSFDHQYQPSIIWVSSFFNGKSKLYYMPLFENYKCPQSKKKLISITYCTNQLLLLFEDNTLWMRKEMSLFQPLGKRWLKVSNVPNQLIQLSINETDLICWCCDTKGKAWIFNLETFSWHQVLDDLIVIKNISVSFLDSSQVWCLDQNNHLFYRVGIVNVYGNINNLIAGTSWFQVETIFKPTLMTVTPEHVWIINHNTNQIARRITQSSNICLNNEWQEIKTPTLENSVTIVSLSGSKNGDVWILTSSNDIWHYSNHEIESFEDCLVDGWCLI